MSSRALVDRPAPTKTCAAWSRDRAPPVVFATVAAAL
jgi:hypothetical protein